MQTLYDFIFIVLVYRNTSDLKDFFCSNNVKNSYVIVVNSFFDEESEKEFKKISDQNHADFLSVPNNGYGAGNNAGIKYALNHFKFKYLIISNADIIIQNLRFSDVQKYKDNIIAPKIRNLKGKNQNPSRPFQPSDLQEHLRYLTYKGYHRHLIFFFHILSRLSKIFFYLTKKRNIFSAHGAFFIVSRKTTEILFPFYNEKMFLFNEEEHLGRKAQTFNIPIIYAPEILIKHKEDGSMKIASINTFEQMRSSFLEYYNFWKKNTNHPI